MLPNRFCLSKKAEEKLKKEKVRLGISPNIQARELFFASVEKGPLLYQELDFVSGKMSLEKSVWLGELETVTELAIKNLYGDIEKHEAAKIWALHVEESTK